MPPSPDTIHVEINGKPTAISALYLMECIDEAEMDILQAALLIGFAGMESPSMLDLSATADIAKAIRKGHAQALAEAAHDLLRQ